MKLLQKITAENWEILIQNERDMNIACTNFTKAFLDISKLCIPKREVTIRSNDKIWFDSILRKEIRKRVTISLGFRRGGTSLVGRSLLSNILIVL
jgi:hypothetical protein